MSNKYLQKGYILHGKSANYQIVDTIGYGPFSVIYLAITKIQFGIRAIDLKVTIKEFSVQGYLDRTETGSEPISSNDAPSLLKNLYENEVQNLSRLDHPNIVKILEAFTVNDVYYYVMEYISGGNLLDLVQDTPHKIMDDGSIVYSPAKVLSEEKVLSFSRQICSALSSMHSSGVLHLDLNPSNIMIKDGSPVLIDFGISEKRNDAESENNYMKVGRGTMHFAPLEQMLGIVNEGFPVTIDIYSLGATMYYMLMGKYPPVASERTSRDPLPNSLKEDISPSLRDLVLKCMALDKSERYQSIEEVEKCLLDMTECKEKKETHAQAKTILKTLPTIYSFIREERVKEINISFFPGLGPRQYSAKGLYKIVVTENEVSYGIKRPCKSMRISKQQFDRLINKIERLDVVETIPYQMLYSEGAPISLELDLKCQSSTNYQFWKKVWFGTNFGNLDCDIIKVSEAILDMFPDVRQHIETTDPDEEPDCTSKSKGFWSRIKTVMSSSKTDIASQNDTKLEDKNIVRCKNCGWANKSSEKFCEKCHASLEQSLKPVYDEYNPFSGRVSNKDNNIKYEGISVFIKLENLGMLVFHDNMEFYLEDGKQNEKRGKQTSLYSFLMKLKGHKQNINSAVITYRTLLEYMIVQGYLNSFFVNVSGVRVYHELDLLAFSLKDSSCRWIEYGDMECRFEWDKNCCNISSIRKYSNNQDLGPTRIYKSRALALMLKAFKELNRYTYITCFPFKVKVVTYRRTLILGREFPESIIAEKCSKLPYNNQIWLNYHYDQYDPDIHRIEIDDGSYQLAFPFYSIEHWYWESKDFSVSFSIDTCQGLKIWLHDSKSDEYILLDNSKILRKEWWNKPIEEAQLYVIRNNHMPYI